MNEIIIGNRIAEGRKAKNLSQAQFAQMLNVSAQAAGKWERGESLPDIITLNKITQILGVSLNYFSDEVAGDAALQGASPLGVPKGDNQTEKQADAAAKNMSFAQWKDADFSGLKNPLGKMSASNVENCKFIGADLSGVSFKANNMEKNDFTNAKLAGCKFSLANVDNNNFSKADLTGCEAAGANIDKNNYEGANLTNTVFKGCNFDENNLGGATLNRTEFNKCSIKHIAFGGSLTDCSFLNCMFRKVTFLNAELKNIFVKGRMKNVVFTNCKADKITFAFLQSAKADTTGITVIE